LALTQARTVASLLEAAWPGLSAELVVVETGGDRDRSRPLSEIGGEGIFAKEVQLAVLDGRADAAVHSAKDLPSQTPDGLVLAAVPERRDPADVLVGRTLEGLGPGATVATGSPRRRALLLDLRPDLTLVELRGNMATRLAAPGTNGIDAVVAAAAALERLGQVDLVAQRLDPTRFTPQVGQGAIAVECRDGDDALAVMAKVDDEVATRCVTAERSFLATLGTGCTMPTGAWCTQSDGMLHLDAVLFDDERHELRRTSVEGGNPEELGRGAARQLLEG
jgi:hydroxymethylbilane synthase